MYTTKSSSLDDQDDDDNEEDGTGKEKMSKEQNRTVDLHAWTPVFNSIMPRDDDWARYGSNIQSSFNTSFYRSFFTVDACI